MLISCKIYGSIGRGGNNERKIAFCLCEYYGVDGRYYKKSRHFFTKWHSSEKFKKIAVSCEG